MNKLIGQVEIYDKSVTFSIEEVTPPLAHQYLQNQIINRHVDDRWVNCMAREMANDSFVTTHEGIAFDCSGRLIDGQHRCLGVINSKKSITVLVSRGWPRVVERNGYDIKCVNVIGGAKPRLASAILQMNGIKNATAIAAIANGITMYITKSRQKLSVTEMEKILEEFNLEINKIFPIMKGCLIPVVVPVILYAKYNMDKALIFAEKYANKTGLSKGDPAHSLLKYIDSPKHSSGVYRLKIMDATMTALFRYDKNEEVFMIRPIININSWIHKKIPSSWELVDETISNSGR